MANIGAVQQSNGFSSSRQSIVEQRCDRSGVEREWQRYGAGSTPKFKRVHVLANELLHGLHIGRQLCQRSRCCRTLSSTAAVEKSLLPTSQKLNENIPTQQPEEQPGPSSEVHTLCRYGGQARGDSSQAWNIQHGYRH